MKQDIAIPRYDCMFIQIERNVTIFITGTIVYILDCMLGLKQRGNWLIGYWFENASRDSNSWNTVYPPEPA